MLGAVNYITPNINNQSWTLALSGFDFEVAKNTANDYFVLITNTSIVPFSYYEAYRNAQENGYIFYLVDQYNLICFLKENAALRGEYCAPVDIPDISISYQSDFGKRNGRPYLELVKQIVDV